MSILSKQVAIVTGASSGIGEAIAVELGKRGVSVVCAARRIDRLDALSTKINKAGGHSIAVQCDVGDRDDVAKLARITKETFGGINILINNAGVMPLSFMDKGKIDEWDLMVRVNINGVLNGVWATLPHMIEGGGGQIVNVSSIAGKKVVPGGAVYCGTKHFVHALSEGLRMELAQHNVRVTTIAPGFVVTELTNTITDDDVRKRFDAYDDITPLAPEDIARSTVHALEAPAHVGINEVVVRPTAQAM